MRSIRKNKDWSVYKTETCPYNVHRLLGVCRSRPFLSPQIWQQFKIHGVQLLLLDGGVHPRVDLVHEGVVVGDLRPGVQAGVDQSHGAGGGGLR